ncbi:protein kinase domain-containing protein [Hyalangium minutum]|uniref:Protein kinase domain protein n=1 Tax=Hyalangium minutum TaxID=394096 RepID=A0A085VWJ9_9BACT|nr:SUMF1/EgtB/PvdO family nonheme iron enzyme [Hyalangium minutum]KFE59812.1 protein kinase domain protein [Hyalangium minutum]
MLCYRCGSHVPDSSDTCPTCGQKYDAAARQAASPSARRRGSIEGAPYKPGDVIHSRFSILEMMGAGPVGYVFRAMDQQHDVEVALKAINPRLLQEPEERTQFSLVLKVGKKLSHPYLSRVYEEGFDGDRPFFTSQLIEGMTLRRMMEMRVAKGQPFTLREVEPLLGQIADALDGAHRYGPHSDLKPENIIVLPDVLKVTDYGLSLGIPRPPFVQAQKGYRAEAYIAPEYVSGSEIDAHMDIYSLAVIVGEMLTGLMPDADGIPEVLMKNPDLPPAFEALYRRALNANPLARPKSAGEFAAEFSSIVAKGPGGSNRISRHAQPLGSSALTHAARSAEKPPPPVPTDQLPIASVSPPVPKAPSKEEPPVDATQPMDADMLAQIMAASPAVAKAVTAQRPVIKPSGGNTGPVGRASAASTPSLHAQGIEDQPTDPAQAVTALRPPPRAQPPAPRQPVKRVEKRPMSAVWLVLLTLAGLAIGSGVGYLVLKHLRSQQAEDGSGTVTAPTPPSEPREALPPPAEPEVHDPMAPAGKCPPGMKLVSGGAFKRGVAQDDPDKMFDERPLENVQVPSFCIDEYEFPNKPGGLPTVGVNWDEAKQSCASVGKRLCTEDQWEKACKGPGNARFPYGNEFDANVCNTDDAQGRDRELAEGGRFPQCRSAYAVADLSGNVAEWTASDFGDSLSSKTQKGGAYDRSVHAVRCSARMKGVPTERKPTVGFRCCADVLQ